MPEPQTARAAALVPPVRPLTQRLFDYLVWGTVIALLIGSFGPVELKRLPMLFRNSQNIRTFARDFMHLRCRHVAYDRDCALGHPYSDLPRHTPRLGGRPQYLAALDSAACATAS